MRSAAVLLALAAPTVLACEREDRPFSEVSPDRSDQLRGPNGRREAAGSHVLQSAFAVSEGQRLFDWFNCSACHGGRGGGHIGPPLTDAEWRYGSSLSDVHRSIAEGRPEGMPAFKGLIVDAQIWQLSGYVLALGGRVPLDVAVGRPDGIGLGEPPSMADEQSPKPESVNR